jgi:hypothetical protein
MAETASLPPAGTPAPLTDDETRLIDAYWRAANYLSVFAARLPLGVDVEKFLTGVVDLEGGVVDLILPFEQPL